MYKNYVRTPDVQKYILPYGLNVLAQVWASKHSLALEFDFLLHNVTLISRNPRALAVDN